LLESQMLALSYRARNMRRPGCDSCSDEATATVALSVLFTLMLSATAAYRAFVPICLFLRDPHTDTCARIRASSVVFL
jgi:hypothetical protein